MVPPIDAAPNHAAACSLHCTALQSVANKGEPFLSGLPASREGVAAFLEPQGLALRSYLGPKDMVGLMLPHLKWSETQPPIASFYCYASAAKLAAST